MLPAAIELRVRRRVGAAPDGVVRLRSDDARGAVEVPADGSAEPGEVEPRWGRYAAGVVRTLAELGRPPAGIDAVVSSTVPLGAGLSSSAALEVAVALALCDAAGFELPQLDLAQACRRAEEIATGVPCGIMDQLASLAGRRDHALLIDCRSLEVEPVPIPADLAVLVVHSGVSRGLAGSAYADRRRECEAVAARLGPPLAARRDAGAGRRRAARPPRRLRERARARAAARALRAEQTSTRSGRSSTRATRACATTSASRRPSSTRSSRRSSRPARSARGSPAPASAAPSSRVARRDEAEGILDAATIQYRAETGRFRAASSAARRRRRAG